MATTTQPRARVHGVPISDAHDWSDPRYQVHDVTHWLRCVTDHLPFGLPCLRVEPMVGVATVLASMEAHGCGPGAAWVEHNACPASLVQRLFRLRGTFLLCPDSTTEFNRFATFTYINRLRYSDAGPQGRGGRR